MNLRRNEEKQPSHNIIPHEIEEFSEGRVIFTEWLHNCIDNVPAQYRSLLTGVSRSEDGSKPYPHFNGYTLYRFDEYKVVQGTTGRFAGKIVIIKTV